MLHLSREPVRAWRFTGRNRLAKVLVLPVKSLNPENVQLNKLLNVPHEGMIQPYGQGTPVSCKLDKRLAGEL